MWIMGRKTFRESLLSTCFVEKCRKVLYFKGFLRNEVLKLCKLNFAHVIHRGEGRKMCIKLWIMWINVFKFCSDKKSPGQRTRMSTVGAYVLPWRSYMPSRFSPTFTMSPAPMVIRRSPGRCFPADSFRFHRRFQNIRRGSLLNDFFL